MDTITRNHIFMEHIDLINRTLRRHRLLLYALHLELDDVYQELAIAALQAIETFDDRRCDSVSVHIWSKLQYAIPASCPWICRRSMGFLLPLKRTATMTGSGRDVCGRPWPDWNPRSAAQYLIIWKG